MKILIVSILSLIYAALLIFSVHVRIESSISNVEIKCCCCKEKRVDTTETKVCSWCAGEISEDEFYNTDLDYGLYFHAVDCSENVISPDSINNK